MTYLIVPMLSKLYSMPYLWTNLPHPQKIYVIQANLELRNPNLSLLKYQTMFDLGNIYVVHLKFKRREQKKKGIM